MKERPLRTATVGSMPAPGWLEFATEYLAEFGADDIAELQDDAVRVAVWDQIAAGLDVITDGEPTRLDFNLSFYGHLSGLAMEEAPRRRFGPPAHDQRGKHRIVGELAAPKGLGVVTEYRRLVRIAEPLLTGAYRPALKASVPGPYTLAGRLLPNDAYPDRWRIAEALAPIVSKELGELVAAGCKEIAIDEPSMSCYAEREDPARMVELFARTVERVRGRCRLTTHLCFGNYKARAVGRRRYAAMFPAFLELPVEEIHLEMASREFAELDLVEQIAERCDVAVGAVDVKSYFIEPPEEVAARVRACLRFAPPERLAFAPDCGLSQTARWAATQKLRNLTAGVKIVRQELGLD